MVVDAILGATDSLCSAAPAIDADTATTCHSLCPLPPFGESVAGVTRPKSQKPRAPYEDAHPPRVGSHWKNLVVCQGHGAKGIPRQDGTLAREAHNRPMPAPVQERRGALSATTERVQVGHPHAAA